MPPARKTSPLGKRRTCQITSRDCLTATCEQSRGSGQTAAPALLFAAGAIFPRFRLRALWYNFGAHGRMPLIGRRNRRHMADLLLDKLAGIEARYDEMERMISDPVNVNDYEKIAELAQERAEIRSEERRVGKECRTWWGAGES